MCFLVRFRLYFIAQCENSRDLPTWFCQSSSPPPTSPWPFMSVRMALSLVPRACEPPYLLHCGVPALITHRCQRLPRVLSASRAFSLPPAQRGVRHWNPLPFIEDRIGVQSFIRNSSHSQFDF